MDIELTIEGIEVSVAHGPYVEGGQLTEAARAFITDLIASLPAMRRFVAGELLERYNSTWLDDDHPPLEVEAFVEKLVTPRIRVSDDAGAALVYFRDSGMFGGHTIEVFIEDAQPINAALAG